MPRRGDPDPLLLQVASERLARLLAEHEPRRAVPDGATLPGPDGGAGSAPAEGGPPTEEQDALPPPRRFGRAHLAVVAAVLLLGVLVAAWGLVRARPVPLAAREPPVAVVTQEAPPASAPPAAPPAAGSAAPAPAASPATELVVHVLGAVRKPGLVRLPAPARVQEAVKAAGGFTRAADPGELNLAQLLTDGQQVVIGTRDDPDGEVRGGGGPLSGTSPRGSGGGEAAVLDLNGADATQLEELPGVGPVTAAKIVAWRDEHGRFNRLEELQEVDGIGPKTYAEIAPHVRV